MIVTWQADTPALSAALERIAARVKSVARRNVAPGPGTIAGLAATADRAKSDAKTRRTDADSYQSSLDLLG